MPPSATHNKQHAPSMSPSLCWWVEHRKTNINCNHSEKYTTITHHLPGCYRPTKIERTFNCRVPPSVQQTQWWQTDEEHVGVRMPQRRSAVCHFPGRGSLVSCKKKKKNPFNCVCDRFSTGTETEWFKTAQIHPPTHPKKKNLITLLRQEWYWTALVARKLGATGVMLAAKFNAKLKGALICQRRWLAKNNVAWNLLHEVICLFNS